MEYYRKNPHDLAAPSFMSACGTRINDVRLPDADAVDTYTTHKEKEYWFDVTKPYCTGTEYFSDSG